jgi:hypothetical protein
MRYSLYGVIPLIALSLTSSDVRALDEAGKAKANEVLEKNKDAIVSVKAVITMTYTYGNAEGSRQSQKQEQKSEVAGAVVDPSGLVIAADPTSNYGFGGDDEEGENFDGGDGENMHIKPKTDINDVKIVLGDGTEIPAEIALKDKEMGLYFIRPKEKPAQPLTAIVFTKTAEPKAFDDLISIRRLSRAVDRTRCVVNVAENAIQGVVKRPRMFYIGGSHGGTGSPAFNMKGEALGVGIHRKNPARDRNNYSDWGEIVVLPAEDVAELIKQALVAKAVEAKPAEPAEPVKAKDPKEDGKPATK